MELRISDRLSTSGLTEEFERTVSIATIASQTLEQSESFFTWRPVLDVLCDVPYDAEDTVRVLWRDDRPGFWTQARKARYVEYLQQRRDEFGVLNQKRLMVFDDARGGAESLMPSEHIFHALRQLHAEKTLFSLPLSRLNDYPRLTPARFGMTLSQRGTYAIIPLLLSEGIRPEDVRVDALDRVMGAVDEYTPVLGPMNALIALETTFVRECEVAFDAATRDPYAICIA